MILRLAMLGDTEALDSVNEEIDKAQEAINKKPKPRNRRITLDVK